MICRSASEAISYPFVYGSAPKTRCRRYDAHGTRLSEPHQDIWIRPISLEPTSFGSLRGVYSKLLFFAIQFALAHHSTLSFVRTHAPVEPKFRAVAGMKDPARSRSPLRTGRARVLPKLTHSVAAHPRPPTTRLSEKDRNESLLFVLDKDTPLPLRPSTANRPIWDPTSLMSGPPRTLPINAHRLLAENLP